MTLSVGDPAPDFSLPAAPGKPAVSLSGLRGRPVVLLFFPLAWSSVCTAELCAIRDDAGWRALAAEILAISVDSPFALAAWARHESLPFTLLSDFNREASRAYGALYEDFYGLRGVSKRSAFVVDADGLVAYVEVLEDAGKQPDLAAVREVLASLE